MSRLDPSRDWQDYLDALTASRELQGNVPRPQPEAPKHPCVYPPSELAAPDPPLPQVDLQDTRHLLRSRDHRYRLTKPEIQTLIELGKFRVIAAADLAAYIYPGTDNLQIDLRHLMKLRLIRSGTFEGPEAIPRELFTLTKAGHQLLRANRLAPKGQALYYGFVRLRAANHDADLYRIYRREADRIKTRGGTNLRVILDFELDGKIHHHISRLGTQALPEIAKSQGLPMVRGKVQIPDVRIEYQKPDGDLARVDLELVTEHYHRSSMVDKAAAGFSLYTRRGEADRLRRVLDQLELTAEILSL